MHCIKQLQPPKCPFGKMAAQGSSQKSPWQLSQAQGWHTEGWYLLSRQSLCLSTCSTPSRWASSTGQSASYSLAWHPDGPIHVNVDDTRLKTRTGRCPQSQINAKAAKVWTSQVLWQAIGLSVPHPTPGPCRNVHPVPDPEVHRISSSPAAARNAQRDAWDAWHPWDVETTGTTGPWPQVFSRHSPPVGNDLAERSVPHPSALDCWRFSLPPGSQKHQLFAQSTIHLRPGSHPLDLRLLYPNMLTCVNIATEKFPKTLGKNQKVIISHLISIGQIGLLWQVPPASSCNQVT